MKNKKIVIIGLVIIILLGIILGITIIKTNLGNFLFSEEGTVVNGHEDLVNHLKEIENEEERKKQIDFSLESNLITEQEANELY